MQGTEKWVCEGYRLWWLIPCVGVTGLRDAQMAGKRYFWVCR